MNLRKQIQITLNNSGVNENRVNSLEKIINVFAIGFLVWSIKGNYFKYVMIQRKTTDELLAIYKQTLNQ